MRKPALYRAAKRGDVIEVRRLLSQGCDPNERQGNDSAIAAAAARGNTPIVRVLLNGGAKPNGYALKAAAFGNHAEAVRALVDAGAPIDSAAGDTPLLNQLKYSGIAIERQREVRRILRDAGARELPEAYLRWRWSIKYSWRWRFRRLLYSFGWSPK